MFVKHSKFDLQSGTFFPKPVSLYECEFPLVTSTCRPGNYLVQQTASPPFGGNIHDWQLFRPADGLKAKSARAFGIKRRHYRWLREYVIYGTNRHKPIRLARHAQWKDPRRKSACHRSNRYLCYERHIDRRAYSNGT